LRQSDARRGLALCYHAVQPEPGDPQRELSAPLALHAFEQQVRHLTRNYRLVTASELPAAAAARRRGEPLPIALTFDDDLRSHLDWVAPALQRARADATFFLTGAGLDGGDSFWWQTLQCAWDRGLVDAGLLTSWGITSPTPTIRDVAREVQGMMPGARDRVAAGLRARLGDGSGAGPLDAGAISSLAEAGFEIGFHTRRHDDLVNLDDNDLEQAMQAGRQALEDAAGQRVTAIAYPHGRGDARVAAAARAAGFRHGFVADGSPIGPESDGFLLGRRYPAAGSTTAFALDLVRTLRTV
jgi:peptidoglycan/xylan/chitin deacetylase (PgdA/CDA1 family)